MTTTLEEQYQIPVPLHFDQNPRVHCALFRALNCSRIRLTSSLRSLLTWQPLANSVVEELALFQLLRLPLLYKEQRKSSDGGNDRKSSRC